jgi:hypothetical protein
MTALYISDEEERFHELNIIHSHPRASPNAPTGYTLVVFAYNKKRSSSELLFLSGII